MTRRYCRTSLVITRNTESQATLSELGVPTELGTDTAWTFTPHPPEVGRKLLTDAGWDGKTPVLIVCPINPFLWPVKASVMKLMARKTFGAFKESHYRGALFPQCRAGSGREIREIHRKRLRMPSLHSKSARHGFPRPCWHGAFGRATPATKWRRKLAARRYSRSDDYDMYQIVSLLRCADMMVSSRYHGIVTSMPALVPSAGVSMDERIRNNMIERGQIICCSRWMIPSSAKNLSTAMETLLRDAEAIRAGIGRTVVRNLEGDGAHGRLLRAADAFDLSGISRALGPAFVGGIFAAAQPRDCRRWWKSMAKRKSPRQAGRRLEIRHELRNR